ncbi:hypothetical protein VaNZ11_016910, partial [Volvox africanus]
PESADAAAAVVEQSPPLPSAGLAASAFMRVRPLAAALSLEGLLALPIDRVRPVIAADLETAFQVISCTEMDQTARYTEWDEQYGSGAAESGRQGGTRGKVWMSMYA